MKLLVKLLAATVTLCLLTQGLFIQGPFIQGASAQTHNCKALTDPLDRLTCNAQIHPQSAAGLGPQPGPTRYAPVARPDRTLDSAGTTESGDDAAVNRKINGICRGC